MDNRRPVYEPTLEEIEEMKRSIQEEWTPEIRDSRLRGGGEAPKRRIEKEDKVFRTYCDVPYIIETDNR